MRLQQLQLLLAIQSSGSLRTMADELHLTQPALSKSLKQLEAEFGTTLVIRGPKGVRLSPAGEMLAIRAGSIQRELSRAHDEISWLTRETGACVTVGVSPAVAILLTPGAIKRFQARCPNVKLKIIDSIYPRVTAQVRSGEVDFALGPLPPEKSMMDLQIRHLFDNQLVIAARKGHRLAAARRLAEVAGAAWVLTGPSGGPGDPRSLPFVDLKLAPPVPMIECESFSTLLALMPVTDLVGILPRGFFERYGPRYDLVELPIEAALPKVRVQIISRREVPFTPAAQILADAFAEEARSFG